MVKSPGTCSPPARPSTQSKLIPRSSRDFGRLAKHSPISPSFPATFSKRTSPRLLPAAGSASTAIFLTTSPRRFFITSSSSSTSSTKFISSFKPKLLAALPHSPVRATTAIFPSSLSSTRAPNLFSKFLREAFNPAPEVTSALVTLRLPGERAKLSLAASAPTAGVQAHLSRVAETRFLDFVKLCFSKKRKTLVNNLRSLAKPDGVREALASLSLRPDARAEQLSVSQLTALYVRLAGAS